MNKNEAMLHVNAIKTWVERYARIRSAWSRGVREYAFELLEELAEQVEGGYIDGDELTADNIKTFLLNGASDWSQFSWGGSSLIYDGDIAERLCTPSELRRTRQGELRPNSHEEWLDTQARALNQASNIIRRATRSHGAGCPLF